MKKKELRSRIKFLRRELRRATFEIHDLQLAVRHLRQINGDLIRKSTLP